MSKRDEQICMLVLKVDDLENRSRRNNLIIYGIEEPARESNEELLNEVTECFQKNLEVTTSATERCHRFGRKVGNKPRPVIIKFLDYREKTSVLTNAFKLKGTTMSISEDFSSRVREVRRNLWKSAAEEKRNGAKVKLIYDKLSIDDTLYGWNETEKSRFKLQKKKGD